MKKITILILFFSFAFVNAQEKPAKKETKEERKQRYINEGNPFKKYGYTPKIATLSKGKYREFFTDSIIEIGSFRFNRVSKQIIGFTLYNKENLSEADLQPELVSRWMSPDPLSDEFPNWSPYNFVYNSPIRFTDPTGLAAEDWVDKDGNKKYDSSLNNGKGGYTEHATAQDKKFGDALKNSGARGAKEFDHLVNSDTKIQVEFDSTDYSTESFYQIEFTETDYSVDDNGNVTVDSAKITIFTGTADKFSSDINSGVISADDISDGKIEKNHINTIKDNALSGFDISVSSLGHGIHHTRASNEKLKIKERQAGGYSGKNNSEFSPNRTTSIVLKDLAKQKK